MNDNLECDSNDSSQCSVSDTNPSLNQSLQNSENCTSTLCNQSTHANSVEELSFFDITGKLLESDLSQPSEFIFCSKGLHFCNLNIRHIVPKLDELRISMAHENCPDIFGMFETF